MTRSKLAIFRVFNEVELADALACNNYDFELLLLAQFSSKDEIGSTDERCSILYLENQYSTSVASKLAFSFAIQRDFDLVVGIFDWGSISLETLNQLAPNHTHLGLTLLPTEEKETSFVASCLALVSKILLSKVPAEFLPSCSLKGLFSGAMLKKLPFEQNLSKNFFDTELLFQIIAGAFQITVLGDQKLPNYTEYLRPSFLQFFKLALTLKLQKLGIFYDPRFDLVQDNLQYEAKFDFPSSHSLALSKIEKQDTLLILGSGPKELVQPFSANSKAVVAVDSFVDNDLRNCCNFALEADLENVLNYDEILPLMAYSKVVALDIIEHLRSPEEFLRRVRSSNSTAGSKIVITTPNIAFLPIRCMLLIGLFNYGKRGILDRTHTRLFTFSSLRRVLKQSGFEVEELIGIPAPIPLAVGRGALGNSLLWLNSLMIKLWPSLFSFQILAVAKALPTVDQLLLETQRVQARATR